MKRAHLPVVIIFALLMIISLVALCVINIGYVAAFGDYWVKRAPMPNSGDFVSTAVIDGEIYVIGSNNTANSNYNYLYNPSTDSWLSKTPMPTVQMGGAIATYQNKIYVIGGGQGITPDITTYQTGANTMYDPTTDTWTSKTPMSMGYANLKAVTVEGMIYVMGGTTVTSMKMNVYGINERYNPETDSWQSLTPMPLPVYNFGMVAIGTKIYILGGLITSQLDPSNKTQIYDTQTDTWSYGTPMPITTCGGTAAAITDGVDSKIYYIGNELVLKYYEYSDSWSWDYTYDSPTQIYDLQTGNWTVGASSPTTRISGASLAVVNNTIYAIGGYDGISQTTANEQYFPLDYQDNPPTTSPNSPTLTPTQSLTPSTSPKPTINTTSTPSPKNTSSSPTQQPTPSIEPTATVPEFPTWIAIPLFMVAAVLVAAAYIRRQRT